MSLARNLSKFKPSSSGLVETADIADDAVSTDQIANNAVINTSGAITTTGAFTSQGIDDNADANVVTITDAEAVGIGKSLTPNNYSGYQVVTVGGSDASTGSVIDMENSSGLINGQLNASSGRLHIGVDPLNANSGSSIRFEVDGGSKFEMDSEHLTINDGNLVIGTSGHGIDFSATSNATGANQSELLEDYEIGTFAYGSNANVAFVSNSNVGKYTKIGNMVHVQLHVDLSSVSSTNHFYISGMPFTSGANTSNTYNGSTTGTVMLYNVNTHDSGYQFNSYIGPSSTNMYFYESIDSSNLSIVTNGAMVNSSELIISHTYFV